MTQTLYDVLLKYFQQKPPMTFTSSSFMHGQGAQFWSNEEENGNEIQAQITQELFQCLGVGLIGFAPTGTSDFYLHSIKASEEGLTASIDYSIDSSGCYHDVFGDVIDEAVEFYEAFEGETLTEAQKNVVNTLHRDDLVSVNIEATYTEKGISFKRLDINLDEALEYLEGEEKTICSELLNVYRDRMVEAFKASVEKSFKAIKEEVIGESTEPFEIHWYYDEWIWGAVGGYITGSISEELSPDQCKRLFSEISNIEL